MILFISHIVISDSYIISFYSILFYCGKAIYASYADRDKYSIRTCESFYYIYKYTYIYKITCDTMNIT